MFFFAIIGFLIFIGFGLLAFIAGLQILFASIGFTGKASPISLVLFAICALLWSVAYWLSPFTVIIQTP